jgi:hypothetical protein
MSHMAEDALKNAAGMGMRQLRAVGSFPGAPFAPWSGRRCSWPRWALSGFDARARQFSEWGHIRLSDLCNQGAMDTQQGGAQDYPMGA